MFTYTREPTDKTMMQPRLLIRLKALLFCMLLVAGMLTTVGAMGQPVAPDTSNESVDSPGTTEAPANTASARHEVLILGYAQGNGNLIPVRAFNGVLISKALILTASSAMGEQSTTITPLPPVDKYIAVVRWQNDAIVVRITPRTQSGNRGPLTMFEINGLDQNHIDALVKSRPVVADTLSKDNLHIQGVLAPYGILPEQVVHIVPGPVRIGLKLAEQERQLPRGMSIINIHGAVHPTLLGAGVWRSDNQLMGILTHQDNQWSMISVNGMKDRINPSTLDNNTSGTNNNPSNPPDNNNSNTTYENDQKLTSDRMKALMDELELNLTIHAKLVDYVDQEQADLVMSYIAGGAFNKAEQLLNEIETLASGTLAEQLNYRRALLQTLLADYQKALDSSRNTLNANDPLVRARGRALFKTLESNPGGTFNNKPLSDSFNLAKAIQNELETLETQFNRAFELITQQRLTNVSSYKIIEERLADLDKKIELNELSWPGYLSDLKKRINQYRISLVSQTYTKAREELNDIMTELDKEKEQIEYKSGAGWYKPGYYPRLRVGRANVLIDRYNESLNHFIEMGKLLPEEDRIKLPEKLAEPLKRLSVAVRSER